LNFGLGRLDNVRVAPRPKDAQNRRPLQVGDHVEASYRDGSWYGATIAQVITPRRDVGVVGLGEAGQQIRRSPRHSDLILVNILGR
jgi:hypothetical protein